MHDLWSAPDLFLLPARFVVNIDWMVGEPTQPYFLNYYEPYNLAGVNMSVIVDNLIMVNNRCACLAAAWAMEQCTLFQTTHVFSGLIGDCTRGNGWKSEVKFVEEVHVCTLFLPCQCGTREVC